MTTTSELRYRTPTTAYGAGRDLLLDRDVTVARFPSPNAARSSRALRALAATRWLEILDAYADDSDVVVVMPATRGSLAEALAAGVLADRAAELDHDLLSTLAYLRSLALVPVSLDAAEIGMTPAGHPLLLPAPGPRELTLEHERLLASLAGNPETPAATPARDDTSITQAQTSKLPPVAETARRGLDRPVQPAPGPAVRFPRAGLTAAETGRQPSSGRWRTSALAVGAGAAILAVGVVATAPSGQSARATGRDGAAAVQAAARSGQVQAALAKLESDPAAAGTSGDALAERLRATSSATGATQSFAAAGVLETISAGRADGGLDGPVVVAVEQAVAPLARPRDLAALLKLVAVDPVAFGPRTPTFAGRLHVLQDRLTGDAARAEAQDVLAIVQAGPAKGQFTATFARLASPVLVDLAIPTDLAGLVAAAKFKPTRFGPGVPTFTGRLVELQAQTGQAAQAEAAELVRTVSTGAAKRQFSPGFRDIALPVLQRLATS